MDSPRNEGKDYFEINEHTGEIYTKHVFDREKQAAYALEVEARDGAPSARPNSNGQPNTGSLLLCFLLPSVFFFSPLAPSKTKSSIESKLPDRLMPATRAENRAGIFFFKTWRTEMKGDFDVHISSGLSILFLH